MSRKIKPIPEAELKKYYEYAAKYLLKPWHTRPEKEPIIVGGKGARFYDAAERSIWTSSPSCSTSTWAWATRRWSRPSRSRSRR